MAEPSTKVAGGGDDCGGSGWGWREPEAGQVADEAGVANGGGDWSRGSWPEVVAGASGEARRSFGCFLYCCFSILLIYRRHVVDDIIMKPRSHRQRYYRPVSMPSFCRGGISHAIEKRSCLDFVGSKIQVESTINRRPIVDCMKLDRSCFLYR